MATKTIKKKTSDPDCVTRAELRQELAALEARIDAKIETAVNDILSVIREFMAQVDERFRMLEARMDNLELRVSRLEAQVDELNRKVDRLIEATGY